MGGGFILVRLGGPKVRKARGNVADARLVLFGLTVCLERLH